jgi:glycosyltransferase involved in cell wall biosynthesis
MRSLVIAPQYPFPENAGCNMRTMNFVRFFRTRGEVDILSLWKRPKEGIGGVFRQEYFIRPNNYEKRNKPECLSEFLSEIPGRVRRIAERRPYSITEWEKDPRKKFLSVIRDGGYDVVLCRYIHDMHPLFALPRKLRRRIIIDYDDLLTDQSFRQRLDGIDGNYQKMKMLFQNFLLKRFQVRYIGFGAALFCSKIDLNYMCGTGGRKNAHIVPNTYPFLLPKDGWNEYGPPYKDAMLFVGSLDYEPNADGLMWFIDEIFPYVRSKIVNARLLVVGRNPNRRVRAACERTPGVELYPNVPDVGSYYAKCGIMIVPILSGGGTRIKILEAAMMGRLVFSTPFGAYGIDHVDGNDIMIFTDKEGFYERYLRVRDEESYRRIVANMRARVEASFSPEVFSRKMERVLHAILSR